MNNEPVLVPYHELKHHCDQCEFTTENEMGLKIHVALRHKRKTTLRGTYQAYIMKKFMSEAELKNFDKKYSQAVSKKPKIEEQTKDIIAYMRKNQFETYSDTAKHFKITEWQLRQALSRAVIGR
jgi:hypothetical protein